MRIISEKVPAESLSPGDLFSHDDLTECRTGVNSMDNGSIGLALYVRTNGPSPKSWGDYVYRHRLQD